MLRNKKKNNQIIPQETMLAVQDQIRSAQLGPLLVKIIFASSTLFYLLPILMAVHNRFQIKSSTTILFAWANSFFSIIGRQTGNVLTSGCIIGGIVSTALLETILFKRLIRNIQNKEKVSNVLRRTFLVVTFLLYFFIYPLSHIAGVMTASQLKVQPLLSLLCLLFIAALGGFSFWMEKVLTSVDFNCDSILSKVKYEHDGMIKVIKIMISTLCMAGPPGGFTALAVAVFLALLVNAVQIYRLLFSIKFYHEETRNLSKISVLVECVLILESFILILFPSEFFIDNWDLIPVVLFVFFFFSVHSFVRHRTTDLVAEGLSEVKSEKDAHVFVIEMIRVATERDHPDVPIAYLIAKHFRECSNPTCFCTAVPECDPYVLAKDQAVTNKLVLAGIQAAKNKFSGSLWIFALYLHCRLKQDPGFSRAKHRLNLVVEGKIELTSNERYLIHQLQIIIERHIKNANKQKQSIPLEKVIEDEKLIDRIKEFLTRLVELNLKKYKMMAQEIVRLNEVATLNDKINKNIRQIESLWRGHLTSGSQNIQLDSLFLHYFKNIVPSYLEAKKLIATIVQKVQKLGRAHVKKNIGLMMYSPQACVLESLFNQTMGIITNASASVDRVLGIEKSQILGQDIHRFMPSFYAKGHESRLKKWLTDQSFEIGKRRLNEAICVDCSFIAFRCLLTLKIHSDGTNLRVYKLLLRDNDRDYLVLDGKGRIQGIGKRLLEEGIFSIQNLSQNLDDLAERTVNSCLWSKQEKTYKQTIVRSIHISSALKTGLESSDDQVSLTDQLMKFQCKCLTKNMRIGDADYSVIFFQEVKRVSGSMQAIVRQAETKKEPNSMFSYGDQPDLQSQRFEILQHSASSQTIFDDNNRMHYSKLVVHLKQMMCNPQQISPYRFRCVTYVFVFVFIVILVSLAGFKLHFSIGLNSFGQVVRAATAAGDNSQVLEILYNNALMSRTYCEASGYENRCSYLLTSSQRLLNQFYTVYTSEIQTYFTEKTSLSNQYLFEKYRAETNLTLGGETLSVSSMQFLQNFYHWLRLTPNSSSLTSPEGTQAMQLLFSNWQSLKDQNAESASFYFEAGNYQRSLLLKYIVISNSFITLFCSLYFFTLKYFFDSREESKTEVMGVYRNISKKIARTFDNYFSLIESAKIKNVAEPFPSVEIGRDHQGAVNYQSKSKHCIYLVAMNLAGLPLFIISVIAIFSMLSITKNTLDITLDLRTSQRKLFQSYFELKTFYLGYNFSKSQSEIQEDILSHLRLTQIEFGTTIKAAIPLFSDTGSAFSTDFNLLLTEKVCQLVADHFETWLYEACLREKHYNILNRGVLAGFDFLQRNTLKALEDLSEPGMNSREYLMGKVYQDLDDYAIFLFKVYQLIEERIIEALADESSNINSLVNFIVYLCLGYFLGITAFWVLNRRGEQEKASQLYGYVLQLPESVLGRKHQVAILKKYLFLLDE